MKVSATATRPDGLVTVVVGPRGQVQDIRLDPRVYRKLDSGELSRAIDEGTVAAPGRDVAARPLRVSRAHRCAARGVSLFDPARAAFRGDQ